MSLVQGVQGPLNLVSQLRVAVSPQGAGSLLSVMMMSLSGGPRDRDTATGGSLW